MKKNLLVIAILSLLTFVSCSKGSQEIQAPSKVELLFNQLKNEPKFLEYLKAVDINMKFIAENLSKLNPNDTSIVRDKTLNFSQKYEKLNFTGIEKIKVNSKIMGELFNQLSSKYTLLNTLSKEELRDLYKRSYSFYFKSKSKLTK